MINTSPVAAILSPQEGSSNDIDPFPGGRWGSITLDSPDFTSIAAAQRVLGAADAILSQGESLLDTLSPNNYTQRVPLAFNASIGGHYRHCLDHFLSLLRGLDTEEVNYDHRERDVRVESQPEFARILTRRVRERLSRIPFETLDAPVPARCEVSYEHGDSPGTGSSVGREIVYCITHAIHHYALISIIARLTGAELPRHFGVAPSTVAHQKTGAPQ